MLSAKPYFLAISFILENQISKVSFISKTFKKSFKINFASSLVTGSSKVTSIGFDAKSSSKKYQISPYTSDHLAISFLFFKLSALSILNIFSAYSLFLKSKSKSS
jgi:hypothetical protein